MPEDQYLCIQSPAEGLYKEKGSKFFAFALSIHSTEQIKSILQEFRKTYYDARHICYAYALGYPNPVYMCSDDGEPPHSAGDPILGQIKSKEITNTLVIVVRYFGGTKLGVGGLINAYKTAAQEALKNSNISPKFVCKTIFISYSYQDTNKVMKLISDFEMEIIKQDFQADCNLQATIRESLWNDCTKVLEDYNLTYELV